MPLFIRRNFFLLRHRWASRLRRGGRAWRYLIGRSTETDAFVMHGECEDITGWYSLEGISRSTVMESAIDRYGDVPGLEQIVDDACSRVAHKWCANGDISSAAEDWAFDLIPEYARDSGITLVDSWDMPAEPEAVEA